MGIFAVSVEAVLSWYFVDPQMFKHCYYMKTEQACKEKVHLSVIIVVLSTVSPQLNKNFIFTCVFP
jgi:hypothetical protein